MLRFFDLGGNRITKEEWRAKLRDPAYSGSVRTEVGEKVIEVAWLGVAHEQEQPPKLFLIRVLPKFENAEQKKSPPQWWRCNWRDALDLHKRLVKELS